MASTLAWGRSLRALRSRNYRLFFAGQSVSLIGTWMTRLATSWIVYQLTDSAFLLGLTSFAGQIPAFFVAPIFGRTSRTRGFDVALRSDGRLHERSSVMLGRHVQATSNFEREISTLANWIVMRYCR